MDNKLSTTAQFDDLCRLQNSINFNNNVVYKEFLKVLDCCEQFRLKWLISAKELKEFKRRVKQLEAENLHLNQKLSLLTMKLKEQTKFCRKSANELLGLHSKVKEFNESTKTDILKFHHDKLEEFLKSDDLDINDSLHEELLIRLNRLRSVKDDDDDHSSNIIPMEQKESDNENLSITFTANGNRNENDDWTKCPNRDPQQNTSPSTEIATTSLSENFNEISTIDYNCDDAKYSYQKFDLYNYKDFPKRNDEKFTAVVANVIMEENQSECSSNTIIKCKNSNETKLERKSNHQITKSKQSNGNQSVYHTPMWVCEKNQETLKQTNYVSEATRLNFQQNSNGKNKHRWQRLAIFHQSDGVINCSQCSSEIALFKRYVHCNECKANVHNECFTNFTLVCDTNNNDIHQQHPRVLMDFISSSELLTPQQDRPLVPEILVKCCNEIDKRGLRVENIYMIPHDSESTRNLMLDLIYPSSDFHCQQQINKTDVHSLCGVVLYFLKYMLDLGDPIVPDYMWNDLVIFSQNSYYNNIGKTLIEILIQMATVNRHTLAFLMIHVRKVLKNESRNHVSLEALAEMFAQKIIYHETSLTKIDEIQREQKMRVEIMKALMSVTSDFWIQILNKSSPESSPSLSEKGVKNFNDCKMFRSPCTSVYGTPIAGIP